MGIQGGVKLFSGTANVEVTDGYVFNGTSLVPIVNGYVFNGTSLVPLFASSSDVLLLNTYPGAAAAYSTRLLDVTYTGGLVRVRASLTGEADVLPDSNNEISLNSLITNLDATATGRGLTTSSTLGDLCSTGSGYVTTWYDQSGDGNDATQTTADSQPMIVDSGVLVEEGGKCAVEFDGSEWLRTLKTSHMWILHHCFLCIKFRDMALCLSTTMPRLQLRLLWRIPIGT